jgi:hypothetical protein
MAIKKTIEIEVTTSGQKPIENLSNNLNQASKQANDLTSNLSKTEKAQSAINGIGDAVGKLNPALGGAIKGMNGVILKMWEMVANPVGAILAGIVITLKFLYEAFQSSVAGGKEIKAVFAAISAVGDQVKDAIFGLGRALINVTAAAYKFITLDFKGAAESMKKANKEASTSYNQLSNAVDGTTAKIIYNLTKQQQAVDKARKQQAVVQSETNKLLVQSRETLTDETASIKDKKKALEEVTKAEKASSAEKVRIAKEDLRIAKERAKAMGGEAEKKAKQELRDLTIALNEAETENAMTGIKLNKQKKMLGRQESEQAKAAADEAKQLAKERNDAAKESLKKQQEDEKAAIDEKLRTLKLSFDEQRKLVNDDNKLSEKDKKDFIKRINEEEKKSIEDHKKAVNDLENRYKSELENLNAKTEQQRLDLQKKRELEELNRIAITEEEKQRLLIQFNEKYRILQSELDAKTKSENDAKIAEENLKIANDTALTTETRLAAIKAREDAINNIVFKSEKDRTDYQKANTDARIQIEKYEFEQKMAQAKETASVLTNLASLVGKQTAAGKALGIATALINTYVGVSEALKQKSTLPSPYDYVAKAVNVAGILATGFKSVKAITAVKVPGGGGGGGGATPSMSAASGGGTPASPSFNVVGNSGVNQIAQTLGSQQPVQAYVVANNVTTAQALDRNIIQNASMG